MIRFEPDGIDSDAELDLYILAFGSTFRVIITVAVDEVSISDRTIQTINDLVSLTGESRAKVRELLYENAMGARREAAYGDPNPPEEQPPKGFFQRLMWRPSKYRFVALSHDDPRHPCYLPDGPDGVEKKLQWLDIRIDENEDTKSRYALIDCRPAWEQEHGVTVVIQNGVPIAVSHYDVRCESYERV